MILSARRILLTFSCFVLISAAFSAPVGHRQKKTSHKSCRRDGAGGVSCSREDGPKPVIGQCSARVRSHEHSDHGHAVHGNAAQGHSKHGSTAHELSKRGGTTRFKMYRGEGRYETDPIGCSLYANAYAAQDWEYYDKSPAPKVPLVLKLMQDAPKKDETRALKACGLLVADGKEDRSDLWAIVMHRGDGDPISRHPDYNKAGGEKSEKLLLSFLPSGVQMVLKFAKKCKVLHNGLHVDNVLQKNGVISDLIDFGEVLFEDGTGSPSEKQGFAKWTVDPVEIEASLRRWWKLPKMEGAS